MSAGIKQLDFYADRINSIGEKRLNEKLCEWKKHYNGTEKHQGRSKHLAPAQRGRKSADHS